MSKVISGTKNLNCNVTNLHWARAAVRHTAGPGKEGTRVCLCFSFDSKMQCLSIIYLFLKLYVHMGVIQVDGW